MYIYVLQDLHGMSDDVIRCCWRTRILGEDRREGRDAQPCVLVQLVSKLLQCCGSSAQERTNMMENNA